MLSLTRLDLALSQVRPLWYLAAYLVAIPIFGLCYAFLAPHGFYAPAVKDTSDPSLAAAGIESMLEAALRRSFDHHVDDEFTIGTRKLDLGMLRDSLQVDAISSIDGTALSFRVHFSAHGIADFEGERHLDWSIMAAVPERSSSAILSPNSVDFYRFPEVDFSKYASPFKEQNEKLFEFAFSPKNYGFGIVAPALTLNYQQDLQLRKYLQSARSEPVPLSGDVRHMVYLSAVVLTTLSSGDFVPMTFRARIIVVSEAIAGIVLAVLFLNSLAYQAWIRRT